MGTGAGDAPTGSSMGVDRSVKGVVAATGWGAKGTDILKSQPESAIQAAARESGLKTRTLGGGGNVHGFAQKAGGSSLHTGASSFTHQKGVVNTLGGARDVTREEKEQPRLPPKGEKRPPATISTIGSLDTWAAEGKAKKEAAMAKIAAAGRAPSLGGDGGAAVHTNSDKPARRHQPNLPPSLGGIATVHAPSKGPIRASAVVGGGGGGGGGSSKGVAPAGLVLGGGVLGGGSANAGMTDAEKRMLYFEKRQAEARARQAAAAE